MRVAQPAVLTDKYHFQKLREGDWRWLGRLPVEAKRSAHNRRYSPQLGIGAGQEGCRFVNAFASRDR